MLPLMSISVMRRIGCGEWSNCVSGCGLPLSRTVKSSRLRSEASRPDLSVTVTNSGTTSAVLLKTWGCCRAAGVASSPSTAMVESTKRFMMMTSSPAGAGSI